MTKINKWFQLEGLDRTHILSVMLQESLGYYDPEEQSTHPAIWNEKAAKCLSDVTLALSELYQAIGEWEEEE